jgi:hypothetical protein
LGAFGKLLDHRVGEDFAYRRMRHWHPSFPRGVQTTLHAPSSFHDDRPASNPPLGLAV